MEVIEIPKTFNGFHAQIWWILVNFFDPGSSQGLVSLFEFFYDSQKTLSEWKVVER